MTHAAAASPLPPSKVVDAQEALKVVRQVFCLYHFITVVVPIPSIY